MIGRTVRALGANDLRGIRRDPMLAFVVFAPVLWGTMLRVLIPPAQRMAEQRYQTDLVPYHPLILSAFLLLASPLVVGAIAAFLVLDEQDTNTLQALRVTPLRMSSYLGYRSATVVALSAAYVVGSMAGTGYVPSWQLPGLALVGLVVGLSGVLDTLVVLSIARNKVEGFAVVRALGLLVAGLPAIAFFLGPRWQPLFWALPPYWPAKAYWELAAHQTWWPYLLIGALYHLPLIWLFGRRFVTSSG